MTDLAARNAAIVRRFIDGWKAKDADLLMSMCTDDIEYINQPLAPVVGQKNVRMIIEGILKLTDRVEWELLNVVWVFASSEGIDWFDSIN